MIQYRAEHVVKTKVVHGCCRCRFGILAGSSLHKEIAPSAVPGRFVVRYYCSICWTKQVVEFHRGFCKSCDDAARAPVVLPQESER